MSSPRRSAVRSGGRAAAPRRPSAAIVVGGGVFGAGAALELRRRGWRVALLDAGPLPRPEAASTDTSKIVRAAYGSDRSWTELMLRALAGWRAWNARWGAPLYHEDGLLMLRGTAMGPGDFEYESRALLGRLGHPVAQLTAPELRARHPAFGAARFTEACFDPQAGWAESGAVMARLFDEARAAGVLVREHCALAGLLERGQAVVGVRTSGGERLRADAVVLAAGAWSGKLLPELAPRIRVVGQTVLWFAPRRPQDFAPPSFPAFTADIASTGFYGFPALPDGTVKIANHGAGLPIDPDAPRCVPEDAERRFRAFLAEAVPGLAQAPLASRRLCLYADTADGAFLIDRVPGRSGLVVAGGGSGHAFKFAPVLGALVADRVEDRDRAAPTRFAWAGRLAGGGDAARPGAAT